MARKSLAEGRPNEGDWRLDVGQYARRAGRLYLSPVHQSPRMERGRGRSLPHRGEKGLGKQEDPCVLENVSITQVKLHEHVLTRADMSYSVRGLRLVLHNHGIATSLIEGLKEYADGGATAFAHNTS